MPDQVAIQGEAASYHDAATSVFFGPAMPRLYCKSFAEVFKAVGEGRAEYGLCAIENSLYGSLNEVYDLLMARRFTIVGEVYRRIEHCLIGLPSANLDKITRVYSHPAALAQCTAFLDQQLPDAEREEYNDTAASVSYVKQTGNPAWAAIGSRAAAELHGLPILAESIETNEQNFTRFLVLQKAPWPPKRTDNKTSLVLITGHNPGALYNALGAFANRSINLSKLQSRPIVGQAWKYMFYLDVETGAANADFKSACRELTEQGCTVTILGSYRHGWHNGQPTA